MSYRPLGGPGPSGSRPNPGSLNIRPAVVRSQRARFPWAVGCLLLVLGFVLGIVALFLFALFYFGSPASNDPLPRQSFSGVTDLSATLSESYLNTTINKIVKDNPVNLAGLATIKESQIRILPNQQIEVLLRLGNKLVDFDITAIEQIKVANGKINLQPVGQPKVGKGNLPFGGDRAVELANTALIEPEINRNLADVVINNRKFRLVDVTTAQGVITLKFNIV